MGTLLNKKHFKAPKKPYSLFISFSPSLASLQSFASTNRLSGCTYWDVNELSACWRSESVGLFIEPRAATRLAHRAAAQESRSGAETPTRACVFLRGWGVGRVLKKGRVLPKFVSDRALVGGQQTLGHFYRENWPETHTKVDTLLFYLIALVETLYSGPSWRTHKSRWRLPAVCQRHNWRRFSATSDARRDGKSAQSPTRARV